MLLVLIGIARGQRGDLDASGNRPHDRRKQMWRMLLMAIPNLAAAPFFLFGMPLLTGMPISALRILYPDLGYALMVSISTGIIWSAMYTALALRNRIEARQRGTSP